MKNRFRPSADQRRINPRLLLADFDALHRHYLQFPAVISRGKDAKILAALWRSHPAYVSTLMPYFFAERDGFVERGAGYTVGMYQHRFAGLLLRHGAKAIRGADDWQDECRARHDETCLTIIAHKLKDA